MSVNELKSQIHNAWRLRWNQDIERTLESYRDLKARLDIKGGDVSFLRSMRDDLARFDEAASVLLLGASLKRPLGDWNGSISLLDEVAAEYTQASISPGFYLYFEKGLIHMTNGDSASSLDCFQSAKKKAVTPLQRAFTQGNILFCMENLGLPCGMALSELESILAAIPHSDVSNIHDQVTAFRVRNFFHAGSVNEALNTSKSIQRFTQAKYIGYWIRLLPYHSAYSELDENDWNDIIDTWKDHSHRSYRVRTLQSLIHPDDRSSARISDKIDRLYLWTWRWMTGPDKFPADRILSIMDDILTHKQPICLNIEDTQLLRNALLWIGYFDSKLSSKLSGLLASVRAVQNPYPIFEYEALVVQYLTALRDGDNTLASDTRIILSQLPLWRETAIKFRELVETLDEPEKYGDSGASHGRFGCLVNSIVRISAMSGLKMKTRQNSITVNVQQSEIWQDGMLIRSEPMSNALAILRREGTVKFDEFLYRVFGLKKYDSLTHTPKILNLLARIKKLAGDQIQFSAKGGFVNSTGDWSLFRFIEAQAQTLALRNSAYYGKITEDAVTSDACVMYTNKKPSVFLKNLEPMQEFKREDVEKVTGISRSSAGRLLEGWTKKGLIIASGKTKKRRYRLVKTIEREMEA